VFRKAPPALHGAFHAWSLPDRVGFDRAHPCFTRTVWFGFRGSVSKLCWLLISCSTFSFHDAGEE
jgi:hypothetical protein